APVAGLNYYRIKTVDLSGATKYTYIVTVTYGSSVPSITLNTTIINDGRISVQFIGQEKGKYNVRLTNTVGQQLMQSSVQHNGGNSTQTFNAPNLMTKGIYYLEIVKPNGAKQVEKLLVN
ncbi:T9SS type A sorting domain-containing protein, partial [Ferruginibacter sp. SUN002]|uniref:T9SS type A sorting domain-containing protein n=1 Tax=Ferruginibacter sp. SUN002 TaxID=2937789 RepID=UPI003D364AB4